ncbi:phosphotransferase [Kitasatospora sp. NPDC059673]|uniref:phosphotransferase n=1 Tax=Kitasatospora sp. NPDC059673 TaxID=3346901 RepID=UPI00367985B2
MLAESFGLGEIRECHFLSTGLMNGNWRLETTQGAFALKRIMDVPLPLARRNLAVLAELADVDVPVERPLVSATGETVAEIAGRGYSLVPWTEDSHQPGTALALDQVTDLGFLLGQIHQNLNDVRTARLLPPVRSM